MSAKKIIRQVIGLIQIVDVYKSYGKTVALNGISVKFSDCRVFGIVGPNGSGKTTLLKIISGLINYNHGEIYIDGVKLNDYHTKVIASFIEEANFYPGLTGIENLCYLLKISEREIQAHQDIFEIFQIKEYIGKKFKSYSLGMRQRLGLVYTFLQDKPYLLFDEPFNGLDPSGVRIFKEVVNDQVRAKGKTVIIVSHSINDLQELCDEIILINQGRNVAKIKRNEGEGHYFYQLYFFAYDHLHVAQKILQKEGAVIEDQYLIIKVQEKEAISEVIRKVQHLSLGEVALVKQNLTDIYFKYLGE